MAANEELMEKQMEPSIPATGGLGERRSLDLSSPDFRSAKDRLLKLRQKQTQNFLDTAATVESLARLHPEMSEEELVAWLRVEAGLSRPQAKAAVRFHQRMESYAPRIEKLRLAPDVLYALVAADEQTRIESFLRLERGESVNFAEINEIYDRNRTEQHSEAQLATLAMRQAMQKASDRFRQSLVNHAQELLDLADRMVADYVRVHPVDAGGSDEAEWFETEYDLEHEGYLTAKGEIAYKAGEVRADLEILFGANHAGRVDVLELAINDDFTASIALSWHALKDIEIGSFSAYSIEPHSDDPRRLRQCIQFLAGGKNRATPRGTRRTAKLLPTTPSKSFRMLDIAAGIGGAMLGLEAAGFHPVAAFESQGSARELLKENFRNQRVREQLHPALGRYRFEEFAGKNISLVTSGTSLKHFSLEPRAGRFDPSYDNFGHALHAVRSVKPVAFFFEADPRIIGKQNAGFRSEVEELMRQDGYDMKWHAVDLFRIGLPQHDERVVMVGMRDGHMGNFKMPLLVDPISRDISEALGDLVRLHAFESARGLPEQEQELLEGWASKWAAECKGKLAPMIVNWDGESPDNPFWASSLHIEIGKYSETPPTPEKVLEPGYRFKLNSAMLKRLQGLPDDWRVHDEDGRWNAHLLEVAVPPLLAKLVGLAIHAAISGERFDIRSALTEPLRTPPLPPMKEINIRRRFSGTHSIVTVPMDWKPNGLRAVAELMRPSTNDQEVTAWRELWTLPEDDHLDEELVD